MKMYGTKMDLREEINGFNNLSKANQDGPAEHEHPGRCHFESHLQMSNYATFKYHFFKKEFKVWVVGTFPKMVNG